MTIRLIKAAANNNLQLAFQYLRAGDNVNFQDWLYGQTPLHCAVQVGHKNMVQLLLHFGANIEIQNYKGYTPVDIYYGVHLQDNESELLGSSYHNYHLDNYDLDYS
ncbi:MAG: ankyrin repeat domain-containing protein [Pseudomonadota bacterium]